MKVREIKKEDIKVGAVIIDEGGKSWEIKSIQGEYIHFTERTYYSTMDRVLSKFTIAEEEPKSNDTKVMTYVGGSKRYVTNGKNYNITKIGNNAVEFIGDDGSLWGLAKKYFIDPSECRNKLENHINKGTKHDQIGGSHYNINDPIQFAKDNFSKEELKGFYRINIIKYVARYDKKNGLEDLKKAKHYLDMLIELKEIEYAK